VTGLIMLLVTNNGLLALCWCATCWRILTKHGHTRVTYECTQQPLDLKKPAEIYISPTITQQDLGGSRAWKKFSPREVLTQRGD
jgi:hypothetical protein